MSNTKDTTEIANNVKEENTQPSVSTTSDTNPNIKSSKIKVCEVCQQTKYLTEETIKNALKSHENCIEKYAYILHDKDIDETGNLKAPHYHIIIQFKKNDGREIKHIATWFNVEEQYVRKSTSKSKNKFLDMAKYLVHMNAKDKYQYDVLNVSANFDYINFINQTSSSQRRQEIVDLIMNGTITPLNFATLLTPCDYDRYKRTISNTFEFKKLKDSSTNRNMDVIYIQGCSGTGKTTYAKYLAEKRGLTLFISGSGKDFLDGYKDEECIVLDDFRGNNMYFNDVLKLLDNHTNSSVSSRYYNKNIQNCKLLIITSVYTIEDFYHILCPADDEPILQLKRRCTTYIMMGKDSLHVYYFDSETKDYKYIEQCTNPLCNLVNNSNALKNVSNDELIKSLGLEKKIGYVDENGFEYPF